MKSIIRLCGGFLVFFLLFTAPPAGLINAQNDDEKQKPECCFTNPQYAGVCMVNPAEGETCATILDYLNNPNSAGKTYCESTRIRVGWKQADCEKEAQDNQTQTQE